MNAALLDRDHEPTTMPLVLLMLLMLVLRELPMSAPVVLVLLVLLMLLVSPRVASRAVRAAAVVSSAFSAVVPRLDAEPQRAA